DRGPPSATLFPYTTLFRSISEEWVVLRDRAVIGKMRPGESVRVLAWGPRVSEAPSVTQSQGRAAVRVLKMVRSRWVRLAQVQLRSEEHTSELQSRSDLVCR